VNSSEFFIAVKVLAASKMAVKIRGKSEENWAGQITTINRS